MELRVINRTLPQAIEFNFEELTAELKERVSQYTDVVYNEEQIKFAKEDRANLRKLFDAIETERKKQKKECLKPYEEFEAKVRKLTALINEPIGMIDAQVKAFEEKVKNEKLEAIKSYFESCEKPEGIFFEKVFDSKWLNSSVSMKSIQESINFTLDVIRQNLATLSKLPEHAFDAVEVYISTLDMRKAVNEANLMSERDKRKAEAEERAKAEAEEKEAEELEKEEPKETVTIEPNESAIMFNMGELNLSSKALPFASCEKEWINIRVNVTNGDAIELEEWLIQHGIQYE